MMRQACVVAGLLVGCALPAAAEVILEAPVDRWEDALPLGYLYAFADKFVSRSGLHLNGDQTKSGYSDFTYHPFTLEANFCFARAVQEMLVGATDGGIRVFPAIPARWRERGVSFRDLRVPGGHRVSARLASDGSVDGTVTGYADGNLSVALPDGTVRRLALKKGAPARF